MSSYIKDFTFDNLSRIGNDNCGLSQQNIQNTASSNYMLSNFFSQDCNMTRPIDFATSQPNIFYKGGYQIGPGGCNIDTNSELKMGGVQTNPKCRISLSERPFKTIPYLGRGPANPVLESNIQQGDSVTNKKSVTNTSEKSHMPYSNYPLLPNIESTITNPANLVEGIAAEGWVRGGVPSRELQKNADYVNMKNH
tara:strand:- start:964 stop:1548 length:585 start_codon:yes stop_codon:yes gene_type:complete